MSISFLFSSFGAVAEALLERKLDYRSLLRVELLSYGIGYCFVGITLALLGYGVWALAWATVSYALLKTSFLISASPHTWWPSFARAECSRLLNFSTGTTLSRLANFAAANADYFVVGRWLGAAALGLYSRAFQLMSLPMYEFSSVISCVLFPAYARIQNDTDRLRRAYLGAICLSFLVIMPALTILAVTAPDLIAICFGPAWTGAALPLQILCIGGVFQCMYNLADSLARAKGAVYWKLSCHTVYAGCVFVASIIGSRWGITGVAAGVVIAMSVIYVLMARLSLYLTRASWTEFFLSQLPGSIVAASVAFVAIPTAVILRSTRLPHLLILAVTLILALASAFVMAVLLPRVWLDQISHGAIEKAKRWWHQISISGRPIASLRINSSPLCSESQQSLLDPVSTIPR
jgi:PST family polysaccharide transporter